AFQLSLTEDVQAGAERLVLGGSPADERAVAQRDVVGPPQRHALDHDRLGELLDARAALGRAHATARNRCAPDRALRVPSHSHLTRVNVTTSSGGSLCITMGARGSST